MVSWITVHNGGTYRIKVAEEQQKNERISKRSKLN